MKSFTRWIPILALGILSILFLHQLAFTDLILARGDTYNYFYPYWDARNSAMQAGQLPLWNPDIFMGIPLLANPQVGTFYPLNWVTIPMSAPDAIRLSIIMHIIIATWGMYLFYKRAVADNILSAITASMVFVFGGFFIAHIEQINQLQGIAWLPWLSLFLHYTMTQTRWLRYLIILAMIWALQIFSGHTQTVFISGVALGLYALLFSPTRSQILRELGSRLIKLGGASVLTVILALPQLLPTLELTGMSNRGSGLTSNQATAFSLPPNMLFRALLPSYDGILFTEYIGYVGIVALGLAFFAILHSRERLRQNLVWIIFVVLGIVFAVGRYTPIYLMISELPGFDLFRAPARWLVLYALGMSLLAGRGIEVISEGKFAPRKSLLVGIMLIVSMVLGRILPIPQTAIVGSAQPTLTTLTFWGLGLVCVSGLFIFSSKRFTSSLAVMLIGVELFLASQILPFNDLAPRDVYLGQRFTISQMLALGNDQTPSPRLLAISGRLFNLGDVDTLRTRYTGLGMDDNAQDIAFTATKSQEVIFPNLSMTWGIPSIDGYGGGVLPTIYYSQFTSIMLPENSLRTTDGRLGEEMAQPICRGACIPQQDWLRLTNTDYIITDKNFDVPYNGIFFDTSLDEYWSQIPTQPEFIFDAVQVLLREPINDYNSDSFDFLGSTYYLVTINWREFITLLDQHHEIVFGASVVNNRTNTFQQLTPAGFTRILSSDIKLYQLNSSQRAFLAQDIAITPDDWDGHEAALDILEQSPQTIVVHDAPQLGGTQSGTVEIISYEDTRIEITVISEEETYLYVADAYYPGWQATVNGIGSQVYRANVMFRAVRVPAGESTVIFEFAPQLWYQAMIFGVIAWGLSGVLLIALFLRKE